MEEELEVTSADLINEDNHTSCECGNKTIYQYVFWSDDHDCQSCPLCMVSWQQAQIKAMKELIYALSPKTKEETALEINKKYAEIMVIDIEDFDEDMDYSKP